MPSNMELLGATLNSRMKAVYNASSGVYLELGTISAHGGLQVGGMEIPKGDYMISRSLKLSGWSTGEAACTTGENHSHSIPVPGALKGISSGDRVLVAWVGTEPVVVSAVVSS